MFFAPPKVKSLSRYAEFGSYLTNRHFMMMLTIAIAAHLSIIGIYSMMPTEEIIKIPVRVLNIKLTGGNATSPNAVVPSPNFTPGMSVSTPHPATPAAEENKDKQAVRENPTESVVDKAIAQKTEEADHTVTPVPGKGQHVAKDKQKGDHVAGKDSFTTPKKYIRGSEMAATGKKGHGKGGNGSSITGVAGGQEVITRYTQVISQWIINHQAMARAACGEAKEVTGACNAKGQAVVRLRINRDGHIINNTVEHTSGSELVDQAAIVMVRSSDPVPAVPSDYPSDSQLEFLITVQVDLTAKQ